MQQSDMDVVNELIEAKLVALGLMDAPSKGNQKRRSRRRNRKLRTKEEPNA